MLCEDCVWLSGLNLLQNSANAFFKPCCLSSQIRDAAADGIGCGADGRDGRDGCDGGDGSFGADGDDGGDGSHMACSSMASFWKLW